MEFPVHRLTHKPRPSLHLYTDFSTELRISKPSKNSFSTSQKCLYLSSETQPIWYPMSSTVVFQLMNSIDDDISQNYYLPLLVNLISALSGLKYNLNSDLAVNIRYGSFVPKVVRSSTSTPI